jgi:membrane dipeptidase
MNGIVGIGLFDPALCDKEDLLGSFVKSVVHAISVVGPSRVALGSDWDGAVVTSVDASQSRIIYGALVADGGLSGAEAAAVLHDNAARFLRECLPLR